MLTRWVSSPGMLKLQVLEVDLEILLLSFFICILHRTIITQTVDKRGSLIVTTTLTEIHQSSQKCRHPDIHTGPVVLPQESWDWTAPLTSPPRSVDRSQNSSAHWVGWHKQRLSPKSVSLAPQAALQEMRQSFTSLDCVCLFGCRHLEGEERVPNVSLQVTWR